MKLLSLDISTKSTGYAVYKDSTLVEFGVCAPVSKSHLSRGNAMAEFFGELIAKHNVDCVVIEELKVLKNVKVTVMLAQVQGLILRELRGLPVTFVMPTVWRKPFELNGKREEAKKHAIGWCKAHGYDVSCDDDAEAIILGKYFLKTQGKGTTSII